MSPDKLKVLALIREIHPVTSTFLSRECKPEGIFQTRVYGFDYVSPARGQYNTVSGHLSEADSRVVNYKLRGGRWLDGSWK